MSERAFIPEIEPFESERIVSGTEEKWHRMVDHVTADGDRFTVAVEPARSFDPTAYRVNFIERDGNRALGMLVQKAGWYDDWEMRWHREIVFGKHHGLYCDVQRQEWVYEYPSGDNESTITQKLYPVPENT